MPGTTIDEMSRESAVYHFGPFTFNAMSGILSCKTPQTRAVRLNSNGWETNYPRAVLHALVKRNGNVATSEDLCEEIYGEVSAKAARRLTTAVSSIRKRFNKIHQSGERYLLTHTGVGYSLEVGLLPPE